MHSLWKTRFLCLYMLCYACFFSERRRSESRIRSCFNNGRKPENIDFSFAISKLQDVRTSVIFLIPNSKHIPNQVRRSTSLPFIIYRFSKSTPNYLALPTQFTSKFPRRYVPLILCPRLILLPSILQQDSDRGWNRDGSQ